LGQGCATGFIGLAQPVVNAGGMTAKFLGQFTGSIICSRNCAEYGGLGVCGLDTLDSFCKNNKVSVKWGQLHFGMKTHIGVDSASGIVHGTSVSAANEHDSQQLSNLLHGDKTRLYGDSTYANQKEVLKAKDFTNTRAYRTKSQTRAKVEHPFLTLKRIWGNAQSVLP
jgi:IS5 family transposase